MMAPVHSKEAASKLGMYLLKFLKNILILNYPHNWVWCKGGTFFAKIRRGEFREKIVVFNFCPKKWHLKTLNLKKVPNIFRG